MKCTRCGEQAIVRQDYTAFDFKIKVDNSGNIDYVNKEVRGIVRAQLCKSCINELKSKFGINENLLVANESWEEKKVVACIFGLIFSAAFGLIWNRWETPYVNIIGLAISVIFGIFIIMLKKKIKQKDVINENPKDEKDERYEIALNNGFEGVSLTEYINFIENAFLKEVCFIVLFNPDGTMNPILPRSDGWFRKYINMNNYEHYYKETFGEPAIDAVEPLSLYKNIINNE